MTSCFLRESTYAQSNQFEVCCELHDYGSHDIHGATFETLSVQSRAQSIHPKLSPLVIEAIITLILNYHIVHDHTSRHHLSHRLYDPCSRRVPNNSPTRLEHTKSSLHILLSNLLFLSNLRSFSPSGARIVFTNVNYRG